MGACSLSDADQRQDRTGRPYILWPNRRFGIDNLADLSALSFAYKKSTGDFTEFREFRQMRARTAVRFTVRGLEADDG